ncbi:MAG: hypothetical protein JWM41_4536 [Gemmatimonadetes bacterium]|nr:hypothetical protein [Gemmatimonadota bacterium]
MLVAILLAAVVAFSGAYDAPFQFDDVPSIAQNRTIERLWPPGAALTPPPRTAVSGRPVANLSLAVNYAINAALGVDQRNTIGYHVVNLLVHLACGLLVFGIVRRTIRFGRGLGAWTDSAEPIALAVTALWLLHPVQTEAVDYVVQRTELFVSLFYSGTLYASIRAWDAPTSRRRAAWCALAAVLCLLGMGSKEVMVSAPLIVVLYDRAFRAASWKELWANRARRWLYAALVAATIWLAVLVSGGARSDTVGFGLGVTWYQYLYSQAWAISHYITLLILPADLTYDYGQDPVTGLRGLPGLLLLTAFGVATIVAWTRDRWRWFGFLGAWFFLLLGPSSSFVPIRTEIAAERRVYLASLSVIVLVVVGIVALLRRTAANDAPRARRLSAATRGAFGVVLAAFAVTTFHRSTMYRDPERLWRESMERVPANARAYENVAAVLLQKNPANAPEAERLLRRAIAIDSMYLSSWTNLADIELEQGRTAEGRELLERVLRIDPGFTDANARLGGVLVKSGEPARAIPLLERAVSVQPTDESLVTLALAYTSAGRGNDATNALRAAIQLNPGRADAAGYLGAELAQDGHSDEAVPYLETATRGGGGSGLAYALLSLSYAQTGRAADAIAAANASVAKEGNGEAVYLVIGRTMLLLERPSDGERFFSEAVRLAPNDPEAVTRLGIAKAAGGNTREAAALFRRALAIQPGYPPAAQAIAKLDAATAR